MSNPKRIKENINEQEFKKLIYFANGDESLRVDTRINLLRTFTILFYTGLRVNEIQSLKISHIQELIEKESVIVYLSKTNSERKLYLTDNFKKALVKLFDFSIEDNNNLVVYKGSNKKSKLNNIAYIQKINIYMKKVLGKGYTSHSFRQGLLTEMGSKGINLKIMCKFIGHSDVKTTLRYLKPTDNDIKNSLVR